MTDDIKDDEERELDEVDDLDADEPDDRITGVLLSGTTTAGEVQVEIPEEIRKNLRESMVWERIKLDAVKEINAMYKIEKFNQIRKELGDLHPCIMELYAKMLEDFANQYLYKFLDTLVIIATEGPEFAPLGDGAIVDFSAFLVEDMKAWFNSMVELNLGLLVRRRRELMKEREKEQEFRGEPPESIKKEELN